MMKKILQSSRLTLVLSALMLVAPIQIEAALETSAPPSRPFSPDDNYLQYLPSDQVDTRQDKGIDTPPVPWSAIAFQGYGTGDFEIYVDGVAGSAPVRLTFDPGSDVYPRLNQGATRVAFASNRRGDFDVYTLNVDGSGLSRLTNANGNDLCPSWSPDGAQVAFHSYREGQAEIYAINADGSNLRRLTADGSYDGEPAWSPDGGRIAFTSNRSGQYRIWVMNADGSGPVRLSNQLNSENAAWSHDGQRLAYDADGDGDGWQELWMMNADGSDQHEVLDLTGEDHDARMGSWSPGGQFLGYTDIEWVYYQGQWYWTEATVWVYDYVGEWMQTSSDWEHTWGVDWQSTDPWSPDSAVSALPVQSPGPFTVSWAGSDSGPSGLHGYQVQVRDGLSGAWTNLQDWTMSMSASYPGVGGHTYYFRSRARDHAGNVEAWPVDYDAVTFVETMAPRTMVGALPPYSHSGCLVMWGGTDVGGSGVQSFDVQVQDAAGGSWTDWQTTTLATSARFFGTPGHTYRFRSRAIDRAQNAESWPPDPGDAQTALYTWSIAGMVSDAAGVPIAGVEVTTDPPAMAVEAGDPEGAYAVYVAESAASYSALWSKSGYGPLADTVFAAHDAHLDAVLPPADNVVSNWDFETGSLGPEWLESGAFTPAVIDTVRHTGSYAAYLGQHSPSWSTPAPVANEPGEATQPRAALDASGALHVVWRGGSGELNTVYYARRSSDGTWSAAQDISASAGDVFLPKLAVEPGGVAHVVWLDHSADTYDVYYARRAADGSWSAPLLVSDGPGPSFDNDMALDEGGAVHVTWNEYQAGTMYSRRDPDGSWSEDTVISSHMASSSGPQIDVDGLGRVHVTWLENIDVYYARRDVYGAWSLPRLISAGPYGSWLDPRLAVADDGTVHVVWWNIEMYDNDVYYIQGRADGSWTPFQKVHASDGMSMNPTAIAGAYGSVHVCWDEATSQSGTPFDLYCSRLQSDGSWASPANLSNSSGSSWFRDLAMDSGGTLHAIWEEGSEIYYRRLDPDGNWSELLNLSNSVGGSAQPSLAVEPNGTAHAVWAESSPGDIYYSGPPFVGQTGDSSIAQTVHVPADLSAPVLSVLYQAGGLYTGNDAWLELVADDGTDPATLLYTTTSTAGWSHAWFDVAAWAGQTMTVTFNVHQAGGQPQAWAYLDEISVGSTRPDVWITQTPSATSALPGDPVRLTVLYGNRGNATASSVRLADILGPGLSFVAADPPPSTMDPWPTWEVGNLPAGSGPQSIVITAGVAATVPFPGQETTTATVSTATPELETGNNAAQAQIAILGRLYLPLVVKG